LELAGKATPGPWQPWIEGGVFEPTGQEVGGGDNCVTYERSELLEDGTGTESRWWQIHYEDEHNVRFIAFARTALPALAERVLALEQTPRLIERSVGLDGKRRIAFLRGPYRFEFEVNEEVFSAMGDSENERLRARVLALEEALVRGHKFVGDILLWTNRQEPPSLTDWEVVGMEAHIIKRLLEEALAAEEQAQ
jgi:hypothetical protein